MGGRRRKQDAVGQAVEKYGVEDRPHTLARRKVRAYGLDRELSPLAAQVMLNDLAGHRQGGPRA